MFDAHNHLQRFPDPSEIIGRMHAAGITGCVVNGTGEDDWEQVAALAEQFPHFVRPAFGLHPWKAHLRSEGWLTKLEGYLDRFPLASIGECGVDGWVSEPSLSTQMAAFLPQLALARSRALPITIHALKAWEPLFEALEKEPPPEGGFLLHSFGGSTELAQRLATMGARFSFSGYFLHPRKAKVLDAYRTIPDDRILLETDAPDMAPPSECIVQAMESGQNHPVNLTGIAAGLAGALSIPVKDLVRLTEDNARRFFGVPD